MASSPCARSGFAIGTLLIWIQVELLQWQRAIVLAL